MGHMTQNCKDRESDPEGGDAVDDDDDDRVGQARLMVLVEARQSLDDALTKSEREEYLLTRIRPNFQLQQLFPLWNKIDENA